MAYTLIFYLFSSITLLSAIVVISARNPVHSILFLILSFFSAAGLFVLLGAEFLAMLLIIVYVGAVAVLFMFVIMMLDINFVKIKQGFLQYLPIGALIGLILMIEVIAIIAHEILATTPIELTLSLSSLKSTISNSHALGEVLYTKYIYLFQSAGLILLSAMIGAIVLTHRVRKGVKKQDINEQIMRNANESVKLKKVEVGKGI